MSVLWRFQKKRISRYRGSLAGAVGRARCLFRRGGSNHSAPATHQPAILPYNLNAIYRKSTLKCGSAGGELRGNRELLPAFSQNFKFYQTYN
ncbi:hypothetical protein [Rugamonas sp.]|uniref:hypothetical protein n=1 Tax=Rugamonas sp. TaxID=1926287 RepID=UPI0025F83F2B|nr:hypothetical protein [Rugamonas sp.]